MASAVEFDAGIGPVCISAKQLAIMLSVSKRTLYRMRSAGELPSPLRIGGVVRWRLDEITNWIRAGCPKQA